jgi:hypothetical protein
LHSFFTFPFDITKILKTVPGLIAHMCVYFFWSKNLPVTKNSFFDIKKI